MICGWTVFDKTCNKRLSHHAVTLGPLGPDLGLGPGHFRIANPSCAKDMGTSTVLQSHYTTTRPLGQGQERSLWVFCQSYSFHGFEFHTRHLHDRTLFWFQHTRLIISSHLLTWNEEQRITAHVKSLGKHDHRTRWDIQELTHHSVQRFIPTACTGGRAVGESILEGTPVAWWVTLKKPCNYQAVWFFQITLLSNSSGLLSNFKKKVYIMSLWIILCIQYTSQGTPKFSGQAFGLWP